MPEVTMSMSEAYIFHDCQLIEMQGSIKGLIRASSCWITSTASMPASHGKAPRYSSQILGSAEFPGESTYLCPSPGALNPFSLILALPDLVGRAGAKRLALPPPLCDLPLLTSLQALHIFPTPLPCSKFPVFSLLYCLSLCPSRS